MVSVQLPMVILSSGIPRVSALSIRSETDSAAKSQSVRGMKLRALSVSYATSRHIDQSLKETCLLSLTRFGNMSREQGHAHE